MARLEDRFYCVAPDLPGFGESAKPRAGWYSLERYLEFVEGFCDSLELPRAHVVGHSMGGMLSLALAADRPQRVDRLVLVNPVVTGNVGLNLGRLANTPIRGVMLAAARLLWPVAINPLLSLALHDRMVTGPGVRRQREDLAKSTADAVLSGIYTVTTRDLSDRLPAVAAPTLVVIGDEDGTVPPSEGILAAGQIVGARLLRLPCGHLPSDEHPDQFAQALREFFV